MSGSLDFITARREDCLSDLVLDRHLAGELAGTTDAWRVAAHLRSCSRCDGRRAELSSLARSVSEESLPAELLCRADRETKASRPWGDRLREWLGLRAGGRIVLAVGAAVAAISLVVILPSKEPTEGLRSKGGGALALIVRSSAGRVDRVLPGDELAPGDAIRFEVSSPATVSVSIVGIDAAHAVTTYVVGAEVGGGKAQVLPGSIVLDGTLGPERIVALFCERPVPAQSLVLAGWEALTKAGGDPAQAMELEVPRCSQSSVLIRKVARR
ncbi:hypothetical protein [Vulgatibacter incomptus]|nr:hypothetical protein [Vulgatibacter incomptus]